MVRFGMLWNDPSLKKEVKQKIGEGCSAFINKYKKQPTHCSMPPAWFATLSEKDIEEIRQNTGVIVENSQNVHIGSLFIGYPDMPKGWNG